MLARASFRQLLLLAFLGISLLLGAVSLSGLQVLQGLMSQSREAAVQAVGLNNATQGLAERSTDMERSARQYLVLGDDTLRQRFDAAANEAQQLLQPLVASADFAVPAAQWLTSLTRIRTQIADHRIGVSAREQSVAEEFRTLEGLTRTLRAQVEDVIADRNRALQDALEDRRSLLTQQVLAAIVLAALAAFGFGLWLTRPLRRLQGAIVALGENQLDAPVAISGPADLRRLGEQLEWLRLRLTELDSDKARFLRHISHELKTPLAALREGVSLLQEGVGGPLSDDQREIMSILVQNTSQLQRQIEDLLSFNAAAFDARRLQRRRTDVPTLVRQVVESQRLQWQARQLDVQVAGVSVSLPLDPVKLSTALGNLMSNAIRFSPTGGAIRWRVDAGDGEVRIRISDAGPGIAPADLGRIFEPFYRGAVQPEALPRGSGVGLSIVQEIVAGHGGRITLEPQTPGACFCIHLPLRASDA
ncbi:two-component system sensor histidine kinase GlrK [Sphaerotilus hippei]|uniref:histidine kinase n=1 Tax=Sphaerotilus hippei TaxID=744406 RepID=A0A318H626_9BURK|nr:ATP-binding protein [Sphaerotilus hippei]PXW99546.1 two-component system sensor histidine kinase GlrK [Sphaerotilus hippei]